MEFFTRYGTKHEGAMQDVNETKGTAAYVVANEPCHRCGGSGGWKHWPGFTCYRCHGTRLEQPRTEKLYSAAKLEALNATQAKRGAAKQAKLEAAAAVAKAAAQEAYSAFYAANREVVDAVVAYRQEMDTKAASCPEGQVVEMNGFLLDMARNLEKYGKLTENQLAAAKKTLDRVQAREAAKAASGFVGEAGKRLELVVTVEHVIQLEAADSYLPRYARSFAAPTIYLCRDQQGNRIVYKGTGSFGSKGETVKVKATVTEHGERKGEKQTIIARPKLLGTMDAETGKYMIWDGPSGSMKEVA